MTTLPIQTDDATARAFTTASVEEQQRMVSLINLLLRSTFSKSGSQLRAFQRAADAAGREAQANGWNDELDAALLRGDLDNDE